MKIVEWNIRQGGGRRTTAIINTLQNHNPDLLVLTEFRNNDSGKKIRDALSNAGLAHQFPLARSANPQPAPGVNSILVASRFPLKPIALYPGGQTYRCVAAECLGLTLFALYFAQNQLKRPLFDFLLSLPSQFLKIPAILLGDFNIGLHYIDEAGKTFACADAFRALSAQGWTDVWRSQNREAKEFTWYSSKGNGFRIDHLFASPPALPFVAPLRYSHAERCPQLSDHSMLIAEYIAK